MEDRAVQGIPWSLLAYASNKIITVATILVLARLLAPADFGLLALGVLVVGFAGLLNDLGLSSALVLRHDLDDRAQGTALTALVVLGIVLTAALAALSPAAAALFDEPRLTGVLAVLALSRLPSGLYYFYEAVLQRELEFRRRFTAQMCQTLANVIVALALAIAGAGVWSLVAAQVAGSAVHAGALVSLAPYRVRPAFHWAALRDIFSTGRGFVVQGGVAFLHENADYLAVGRILGAAQLGQYSMAYRLGELPYWAIADPIAQVTFPGFARMRARGEDVTRPFLSVLRMVALAACPVGALLSATAEPFTAALLGEKWLPMVGALSVLGIWAAVRPIQATVGWLLNSVGQAGIMGLVALLALVPLVPGVMLAASWNGLTAVAWVMVADLTLSLLALSVIAERRAGVEVRAQWQAVRPVAAAAVVTWATARAVAEALAHAPPGLALAAAASVGLASCAAVVSLLEPGLLRLAVRYVARSMRRSAATPAS